jgi:hypothetical protein
MFQEFSTARGGSALKNIITANDLPWTAKPLMPISKESASNRIEGTISRKFYMASKDRLAENGKVDIGGHAKAQKERYGRYDSLKKIEAFLQTQESY